MKPKNSWAWLQAGKEGLVDRPWAPWAEGKLCQPHTDSERIVNTVIWCQPRH